MDDVRSLLQRLRKSYKAIFGQRLYKNTTMITDFFRLWMGRVQDSGAAIADRVAGPNGKYNNPESCKVASRYDSRLPLSIVTIVT
jgi:hypothetical protein